MATLTTIQGVKWESCRHNGKLAFCSGDHVIAYESKTGLYHLKENGETIFVDRNMIVCLEHATPELIWDYYASAITPSWEATA